MGNTHSSMGLTFGSALGGILFAPFTGGASLVAVGVASGIGTAVGTTTFAYNAINDRRPEEGKETTDLLIGIGCGAIGPIGGMAAGMGAEVTVGVDFLGSGLGLGATNAGDGKFKTYAGNQKEAVEYYTQKEEKKHYEKEVQKEIKAEFSDKLNSYMKEQNNYWNNVTSFIKTKNFNRVYTFNHSKISEKDAFKEIENHVRLYNDDPQVERVYVIRRKLDDLPVYLGWFSHSGLLLKTTNGRWFICEYGTETNKNKVCLYETTNIKDTTCSTFTDKKRKWNKQICGSELSKKISVNSIKETMEDKTCKHSYWMLFWNCHMAQEATRESLGLKVDKKYMDEKFEEEYQYSLRGF